MKKFLFVFSFLLIISCNNSKRNGNKLSNFVPQNASLVFKINDLETFKADLKNNDLHARLSASNTYNSLEDQLGHLDHFKTKNDLLLCLQKVEDSTYFTLITKMTDSLFDQQLLDSTKVYHKIVDSIFIASNSNDFLKELEASENLSMQSVLATTDSDKSFSLLLNDETSNSFGNALLQSDSLSFSKQAFFDIDISPEQILLNGISRPADSLSQLTNIFNNLLPQENTLQHIVPSNADGYLSFTYNDFETFDSNLRRFTTKEIDTLFNPELFQTLIEVGQIFYANSNLMVLRSIDPSSTKEALRNHQNVRSTFRSVDLIEFSDDALFKTVFGPLIKLEPVSLYINVDDFFIFSNSEGDLQNVIANYQNGTIISNDPAFESCMLNLSDESSLIVVANSNRLKSIISMWFNSDLNNISLNTYKLSAFQMVQDDGFAHINGIIKKHKNRANRNTITEAFSIALEADIIMSPQFVTNHRTRQKDIVVQDINNALYLISNTGKILWKKNLSGPVLGNIEQLDLYRNGRLQLTFATENRVYVIDRNGNNVSPFPIKFNDKITQPLSVFDYDNNKRYRLVVTQSNNLLLYDNNAQFVKGFKYNNSSEVVTQPKHIRAGSKDYIVFGAGDKMQILDRRGQIRINAGESINFSGQNIYFYNNAFTTTNVSGELIQVSLNGNVSKRSLGLGADHYLNATSKTLVTLFENNLSIKKNNIDLDFGNYSAPKIFYINDKIYVSLTDLQTQKIYLYDSQTKPIPNFPVYGNSTIDLDNMDADSNLEFVTQGESNSIIVYKKN